LQVTRIVGYELSMCKNAVKGLDSTQRPARRNF